MEEEILKHAIPSTNESIPVIGVGTWQTFNVGSNEAGRAMLKEVLKTMTAKGANVVDSSPMYGSSEEVVGDLSTELKLNEKLFMATKVWTSGKEEGIQQMENSMRLLKRKQIDLMQIHNMVDWQTHLKTLRDWKEKSKIRYIGITHYTNSAHQEIERIIKKETIDFIQINYSLMSCNAESSLFSVAQERKVAVIVNRPFEEGDLFQKIKGKALPAWTADFDCKSWGQFFLKFILSHPAVTCVIPGTSKATHMIDNLQAGIGRLPDGDQRKKMIDFMKG